MIGIYYWKRVTQTLNDKATDNAIRVLTTTYSLATAQIDAATKRNMGETVVQYFTSYYNYIKYSRSNGLPSSPKPVTKRDIDQQQVTFVPNGVLRAHVVKAECCLQIAILQLLQESVVGYIKCGLNLRRGMVSDANNIDWLEIINIIYSLHELQSSVAGIQAYGAELRWFYRQGHCIWYSVWVRYHTRTTATTLLTFWTE